jgi:hypothetical protein
MVGATYPRSRAVVVEHGLSRTYTSGLPSMRHERKVWPKLACQH